MHNLSELTVLHLDNNQLSGELPRQLGSLSKLEQVSIWDNKLTWADRYGDGVLADTVALVALYESTMTHADHFRDSWNWGYPKTLEGMAICYRRRRTGDRIKLRQLWFERPIALGLGQPHRPEKVEHQ